MRSLRRSLATAGLGLGLALASIGPASAEGFTISIASPSSGAIATGTVAVRVNYTVAHESPTDAALQAQPSGRGWVEGPGVPMSASGQGWDGSIDSTALSNGNYSVIVRAWGGGYDPADPASFEEASVAIKVNNAPPVPSGLTASASGGKVTVAWDAISGADRPDFRGYDVYRASPSGGSCPGIDGYAFRGSTTSPSYSESVGEATYCYSVAANRSSPVNGSISSDPSSPVLANKTGQVGGGGGGGNGGNGGGGKGGGSGGPVSYIKRGTSSRGGAPAPPEAPEVREVIPDGPYSDQLPYTPMTVDEFNQIVSEGTGVAGGLIGSAEGQHRAMTLIAAGLLLGVSAMQIRRFVAAP